MTNRLAHAVPEGVDAQMAGALEFLITAYCGARFIPTKFDNECKDMKHCELCYPPVQDRKRRGPRDHAPSGMPHYVYRCYDAARALIYVGCTNNPTARLKTHRSTAWWFNQVDCTRLLVFKDRPYALSKERQAIAEEMPRWNVKGRWSSRGEHWTAENYVDLRTAIVRAVDSTHGVYGTHTKRLLKDVDAELAERFGITSISRRQS